jgi:hypothetical protein
MLRIACYLYNKEISFVRLSGYAHFGGFQEELEKVNG